ncbi:hypothetical protein DNK06_12665 [Pseudomonas daroniae]|uniref:Uncharacterized protein n=1 Tax=Phytopseudomonas daroniae TaxID=2487519 RepID=A0A4Q9QKG6_9GAMM|nr:hypothetical protein DNK06_12665 [Pseudomonas daroniae]TBU80043.1 hypothetical protein DNK31_17520 [Pseudomonas sp. FRB 228]TBU91361.1 hypothetical protein DNJ99_10185 [Pseudomonas daroniae]
MARFPAQPAGPGPFCRDAAFLAGSFSPLNFAARALPRGKTGSGAAVRETSTDPSRTASSSSSHHHLPATSAPRRARWVPRRAAVRD